MAGDIVVRVLGIEDATRALRGIAPKLRRRAILNALRAAARDVRDQARRATPVLKLSTYSGASAFRTGRRTPGTLKRAISVRLSRHPSQTGAVAVFVNVRPLKGSAIAQFKRATGRKARDNPADPFYWRFINFPNRKYGGARFLEAGARALPKSLKTFERTLGPAVRRLNVRTAIE